MIIKLILISFLIIEIVQLIDMKTMLILSSVQEISKATGENVFELLPKHLLKKQLIYVIMTLYYIIMLFLLLFTRIWIVPLFIFMLFFFKSFMFKDSNIFHYIDFILSIIFILYGLFWM